MIKSNVVAQSASSAVGAAELGRDARISTDRAASLRRLSDGIKSGEMDGDESTWYGMV
jgi:hypothetical protein